MLPVIILVRIFPPGSIYSQHLVYMAEKLGEIPNNTVWPRQIFGHNLKSFIEKQSEVGHQMIVCEDFNSEYENLVEWMLDVSLQNMMAKKYSLSPKPVTYLKLVL